MMESYLPYGHLMLTKMPGDEWQRFANLRLLYSYMFTHPFYELKN